MAGKDRKQGPGKPAPAEARAAVTRWIATGHLEPYPEQVQKAALNLSRIAKWPDGFGLLEFQQAVFAYDQTLHRVDAWDQMPQREREIWIKQFEATVEKLIELMADAPRPPHAHGFPIRDTLLLHVMEHAMHVAVPQEEGLARWQMMRDIEQAFDGTGINFEHALLLYRQNQRADYGVRQPLAKPREETAPRAYFAVSLWRYTYLEPPEIAAVASVVLDEDVSPNDVRRWVKTYCNQRVRDSSKREKPASRAKPT